VGVKSERVNFAGHSCVDWGGGGGSVASPAAHRGTLAVVKDSQATLVGRILIRRAWVHEIAFLGGGTLHARREMAHLDNLGGFGFARGFGGAICQLCCSPPVPCFAPE
jgi:hypothetical protein